MSVEIIHTNTFRRPLSLKIIERVPGPSMPTESLPHPASRQATAGHDNFADSPLRPELIEEQLEEVVNSEVFRQSVRMTRFLTHVVKASLRGDVGDLKETSIGVSVYDRQPGYDPKVDPVVRNEARRLRQKLQQYYESEGSEASISIMLPRGGYAPSFCKREIAEVTAISADLIAPVTSLINDVDATREPHLPERDDLKNSKRIYMLLISVLGLVILLNLGVGIRDWRIKSRKAFPRRIIPLTSVTGQALYPSISADGTKIAFAWDGNSLNFDLYVTKESGKPLRLTTDAAFDLRPSWSPDGTSIAYLRSGKSGTDVMLLEVPGGQSQRFFSLRSPLLGNLTADPTQIRGNPGPSWTPDSKSIVYSDQNESGRGLVLFERDLKSGVEKQLTRSEGETRDYSPIVSPDGKQIAFIRNFTNSGADLFMMPLAGGIPHRLTNERTDILGASWLSGNHSILFSSNRTGPYCLWVLDTDTGSITAVPTSSEEATDPSADAKGDHIVFADTVFSSNIRRLSLETSTRRPGKYDQALFPTAYLNNSARYSPDNTRIAFISNRSGAWELWVTDIDSNEPHQLTHFNGPMVGTPHWSPDGKKIVFDARPTGVSNIFVVSSDGGDPAAIIADRHEQKQPYWSHDGKSIYFYSDRDGHGALWRASSNGRDLHLVCHCAAMDPQESVDGKTIYFTSSMGPGLFEVSSSGGDSRAVRGMTSFASERLWEATSQGIFFVMNTSSSTRLERYDPQSQTVVDVLPLPAAPLGNTPSLSLSSDLHSVLLTIRDESRSNIKLIQMGNPE